MHQLANPTLLAEPRLHRFLDHALLGLEWGSLAALLLITLVQPATGRTGLPTWALVLLFAADLPDPVRAAIVAAAIDPEVSAPTLPDTGGAALPNTGGVASSQD